MRFYKHVEQALVNLMAAKLRSCLAVLGILVGTASVVALISCGQLATEKALEQFKALGTDLLAISAYQRPSSGPEASAHHTEQIDLEFWRQFPQMVPAVLKIAPYSTAYQSMSFEGRPLKGAVIGADDVLATILHIQLLQGRFVSFVDSLEHVCVIGYGLAQQLKTVNLENPIGKQLRLGQALYTIIGVTAPSRENGFFNEDVNQAVIIPIKGMMLVSKDAKISNAVLLLKTDSAIDEVITSIQQLLAKQAPGLNIFIRSAKQIIASMESQGRIFTLLLAVIGGISLLVGGIGVMNVMLVSVSERKKEIGIRKAVGAKNRDIQALFLAEALMLSLLGGGSGVILGLLFTWIIAYFSQWSFTIHLMPPVAGFAVSVFTGIFFGFYPAHRAAVLEPIVSLRSE